MLASQPLPTDTFWPTIASTVTSSVLIYVATHALSRFGWHARLKDDMEAYKYLESISEKNRTADEEFVLSTIRNRSFETAGQRMRQSTLSSKASLVSIQLFFVCSLAIILSIPLGYVLPELYEAFVGFAFMAWAVTGALLLIATVWSAIEASRAQNAQRLAGQRDKPIDIPQDANKSIDTTGNSRRTIGNEQREGKDAAQSTR